MATVDDKFRIGYCWDQQVQITHDDFTSGNLAASTFKFYINTSTPTLLHTITAGGAGYTLSGTTVTLEFHADIATVANITPSKNYATYIVWEYSTHKKRFEVNNSEYVWGETEVG
jgi:hypothetical protein